jgi:hypothetical protein
MFGVFLAFYRYNGPATFKALSATETSVVTVIPTNQHPSSPSIELTRPFLVRSTDSECDELLLPILLQTERALLAKFVGRSGEVPRTAGYSENAYARNIRAWESAAGC